jgi:hypothetical protein
MELRALQVRLKAAGDEGKGLKRRLYKKMDESVQPLARKVADVEHLKPYMPDRYAAVLAADLTARISKRFSGNPQVEVRAKARQHKRKVVPLDAGRINHPIYAQGERKYWRWSNAQTGGMRPGFFSDAVKDASPQIRDKVLEAMTETAREITGK